MAAEPPAPTVGQSQGDPWWTGPMLANSAATLPRGHFLIEPYLYDVTATHSNSFGSLTYMQYGLADRLTVGLIPVFGYNKVSGGPNSSGVGLGDISVQAQYRLTQFHEGSWIPTIAFELQETFPTGKYDRLGNRPSDGLGSGAHTTTLQLNTQTYFRLANGRTLRMRFNVSQAYSNKVSVEDVSVYNTLEGFRGNAKPGSSFLANAAWEYSMTQRWVLALDVTYRHNRNTRVSGYNVLDPHGMQEPPSIRHNSGPSVAFGFAPALEYSWNANVGVLLGTRVVMGNRRTASTITPAIAINYVH
ncbi:transporter [Dyella tabacisoli]|uniref:transporter n=1 Tax=Dyella tabacisoli TaxID=2282381 RepID=UPI001CDCAF63|nr:transporter [Dyella tabacisoli]